MADEGKNRRRSEKRGVGEEPTRKHQIQLGDVKDERPNLSREL